MKNPDIEADEQWGFSASGDDSRIAAKIRDDGCIAVAIDDRGTVAGVGLERDVARRLRDFLTASCAACEENFEAGGDRLSDPDMLRIVRLEARIATLAAALRPFAEVADDYLSQRGGDDITDDEVDEALFAGFTVRDLARARDALARPVGTQS